MKKKLLSLLLAICMIVPMAFSLVACDDDKTPEETPAPGSSKIATITADNITLSQDSYVYDSEAKEPTVTLKVGDVVIDPANYTVTYANNQNAGTASVTVTSVEGSAVLEANVSATKTFEIARRPVKVGTLAELNNKINITDSNHVIVLKNDIESDTSSRVLIFPTEKDMDVAIDLAGYDINTHFQITSREKVGGVNVDAQYKAKVNIFNSSAQESVVGNEAGIYGIVVKAAKNFDIDLNNVTFKAVWGGITTNGIYESETTIDAVNCKFIATKADANLNDGYEECVGAYLSSGKHIYTFDTCTFEGFGAYYTKSGHHKLINCTLTAKGAQAIEKHNHKNGGWITGAALMVDSSTGYHKAPATGYEKGLTVDIYGGTYSSVANYAIQEFSTWTETETKIAYAQVTVVEVPTLTANANLPKPWYAENDGAVTGLGINETANYNAWDGSTAGVPAADQNVITITTAEQLAGLAKSVNAGTTYEGITIKLGCDIDLLNKEWTPIGYGYKKDPDITGPCFKGTFDGQNHTIYNLKITGKLGGKNNLGSAGVGLFGYAHNADIKNIKIDGATVTGNHYVAVVVGFTYFSNIYNCDVTNAAISCTLFNDDENGDKAGIITGYVDESDMTECNVSNCTVSASRDAGQLIGCESNGLASNGEEDITTGNSAVNVVVSWNNTGTGANIKNEFVGRDA